MIVNAANKSLLGGGGVDGAIHRAAGRELLKECEGLGGAETGQTKVTKAYNVSWSIPLNGSLRNDDMRRGEIKLIQCSQLPSKFVAHTVGPVYSERYLKEVQNQLKSCYQSSLERCVENGCKSIGFSSISTGICKHYHQEQEQMEETESDLDGYPIEDATRIALETTRKFLENHGVSLMYPFYACTDQC